VNKHYLITGGAGYIGSLLTSVLLRNGQRVTVADDLLFGGESLLGHFTHPDFRFVKGDVFDVSKLDLGSYDAVIHLAAIVGFPACQAVGREAAWQCNVEATQRVYQAAAEAGAERFVFASTYSNYGLSEDGRPVTEDSPLNPQSLYAETKIAAEEWLLAQADDGGPAPLLFRFATLFGISPRTRFDLIVNQFVLEALTEHKLLIYQRGYSRSFVHVRDVVRGIGLGLEAPLESIRGQVFNLGSDAANHTKDEIVQLIQRHVPGTEITYKDLSFGGDMRNITVSFAKIKRELGFDAQINVEDGIIEVRDALRSGLIKNPMDDKYRNARFIVQ
jgi:nucleoside-diphosphate-sugar epimerase